MTIFNTGTDGDFYCDYRLYYQLLSSMWNFVFANSAILASGYTCSSGYVHQSVPERCQHLVAARRAMPVKGRHEFLPNVGESSLCHLLFLTTG